MRNNLFSPTAGLLIHSLPEYVQQTHNNW